MRLSELFGPTIQGEGKGLGRICHFIRFSGCDQRCLWCDTPYAISKESGEEIDPDSLLKRLDEAAPGPGWVVLTGGNPLIQDAGEMDYFIRELPKRGKLVSIETQGTIYAEWIRYANEIVISPKPPSAWSQLKRFHDSWAGFQEFLRKCDHKNVTLKIAIRAGFRLDLDMVEALADHVENWTWLEGLDTVYVQPALLPEDDPLEEYRKLVEQIKTTRHPATITVRPQMHAILWGRKRGV